MLHGAFGYVVYVCVVREKQSFSVLGWERHWVGVMIRAACQGFCPCKDYLMPLGSQAYCSERDKYSRSLVQIHIPLSFQSRSGMNASGTGVPIVASSGRCAGYCAVTAGSISFPQTTRTGEGD